MRDELVSRGLAVRLKDIGFDADCEYYINLYLMGSLGLDVLELRMSDGPMDWNLDGPYTNYLSIPTQSLAQRWFREVHGISIEPWYSSADRAWICDEWVMNPIKEIYPSNASYPTYEEALEAGLKVTTKYIKEVRNGNK